MNFIYNLKSIILEDGEIPKDGLVTKTQIRGRIFLISFTILFFELFCIRWLPAYVRFLSYFTNIIVLASFLGIGLGVLISRREKLILPSFPVWLLVIVSVTIVARFTLYLPSTQVLYFVAGESIAPPENSLILPVLFILVTVAFTMLARPLGKLLTELPPLEAYTFDILGSLAGIVCFSIASYLWLPPYTWLLILIALIFISTPKARWLSSFPFLMGSWIIVYSAGLGSIWSPYYRIQVQPIEMGGYLINVNNISHQVVAHFENKEDFYFRVYDLFKGKIFKKVLVLGAGSGSDVAIALHNGADEVDAVEIDPAIYQLGISLNPDHPYADPRVKVYVTDGRSFLRNATEKYDLIIFALPDSLTLTSAYSSLRLESFLLTTDAFENARQHLTDNGLIVLYNYYRQDWLVQKLAGMVNSAFGQAPYVTTYGEYGRAAAIIDGPGLNELDAASNTIYSETIKDDLPSRGYQLPVIGHGRMVGDPRQALATDNWPFVYMPIPIVPTLYIGALGTLLLITLCLTGMVVPKDMILKLDWHFFFLGVAFLLLETRSLTTFGLMFGNTWIVNSLVFFGILSSVLLAIPINTRVKLTNVSILYVFLLAVLLLNYFLPTKIMLGIPNPALRYSLASLLAFAPIFCANLVFSHSFRDSPSADIAFASNMLGALLGGILEYASLALGFQALILLIILFYTIAYGLYTKPG
jgi:hypothetical protein